MKNPKKNFLKLLDEATQEIPKPNKKLSDGNKFRLNVKDAELVIAAIEHCIGTKKLTSDQVDDYRYIIAKFQLTDVYLRKHNVT